jgi:hypothetical protein
MNGEKWGVNGGIGQRMGGKVLKGMGNGIQLSAVSYQRSAFRLSLEIRGPWDAILASEQTMTGKQQVESLLHKLQDNCSLEDIQYHLYVIEKVQRGLEAAQNGTLTHEATEQRLGKWLVE